MDVTERHSLSLKEKQRKSELTFRVQTKQLQQQDGRRGIQLHTEAIRAASIFRAVDPGTSQSVCAGTFIVSTLSTHLTRACTLTHRLSHDIGDHTHVGRRENGRIPLEKRGNLLDQDEVSMANVPFKARGNDCNVANLSALGGPTIETWRIGRRHQQRVIGWMRAPMSR